MRNLNLKEHRRSENVPLSDAELKILLSEARTLDLNISPSGNNKYDLTPGSTVGAVEVGGISVVIEPKMGIGPLISLACYAIGKVKFQETDFHFPEDRTLPDALALAFSNAARRAFGRGLLHGYLVHEEALQTVRGRIQFNEQIRRRFGIPLPVEVRYDEFTDDILANRLVKAAVAQLGRSGPRSKRARMGLGWVWAMLDNVSLVEFSHKDVPEVKFDRLNEHYGNVVSLARLILRHGAFESGRGEVRAQGFLMDMNVVFQEFVTEALREALGVRESEFKERNIDELDEGGQISLKPDLVWQEGNSCRFIGDAKYKLIKDQRFPNADMYQMLAYLTASRLSDGMLIYAKDGEEVEEINYRLRNTGKNVHVVTLDLSGSLDEILRRVRGLGDKIRRLAEN